LHKYFQQDHLQHSLVLVKLGYQVRHHQLMQLLKKQMPGMAK
jgi:hypothetical protein